MEASVAVPQHMVALEYANAIRLERAQVKRDLAAGKITFAAALEHPAMQSASLFDVLMAVRRYGRTRARKACSYLAIGELKRVGDLTDRQRERVVEAVSLPATAQRDRFAGSFA